MRVLRHTVAGDVCQIYVPEHESDLDAFDRFLAAGDQFLAVDTESTGLDLFADQHKLRLVQIGNSTEAWVLRADLFRDACIRALSQSRNFIMHNAPFDVLTVERHLGIPLDLLMPRTWDTRIMAHILEPREKHEGGIGLGLKNLSAVFVDPGAPDTQNDLTKVFNAFGWTKATGWARISIDHMTYQLYAGLDVILTHRLFQQLLPATRQYNDLCKMEHRLQYILTSWRRRGMLLDIPYVERLSIELHNEYVEQCDLAAELGVESVFSNDQVIARLQAMGEELTARTEKGAIQVDRAVLEPLADLDRNFHRMNIREPNPLADAVSRAKRAKKWLEAYAQGFLDWRDSDDRIHPVINSLQARTARMSVSTPALHQLPSSDWRIRRSFIPDPGMVMISADYKAVEMRVLAALSHDYTMRNAISKGLDLHDFTAERVFGPGFTSQQRKIAKNIGFGKVYGGGAAGVARLTGADEEGVRVAMAAYDATFPGVRRYSQQLIRKAKQGLLEVVTPIGRRLPLDPERLYAATNYMVQSSARDLLAQAIIRLHEAKLSQYLLLPVHDELLGQAPKEDAEEIVHEIGSTMECDFQGVSILSSAEVYGDSWGAGYKAPSILPPFDGVRKQRKVKEGSWEQDSLLSF